MAIQQQANHAGMDRPDPIVEVHNLQTVYYTDKEVIHAVDRISFDLFPGLTVGIVGESGSGKTVTARSIMGLIEEPGTILKGTSVRFNHLDTVREFADKFGGRTVDVGRLEAEHDVATLFNRLDDSVSPAWFGHTDPADVPIEDLLAAGYGDDLGLVDGSDCIFVTDGSPDDPASIEDGFVELSRLSGKAQRAMRGGKIAMVFQDPLTSLNPVYTVGNQLKEAIRLHQGLRGSAATEEAVNLLEAVGIPDARRRVKEYPHQFSGGMRQRVVIAMALACEPEVLICDEPTTALDVTIQAQILELIAEAQRERDLAVMFITHDMGVIAEVTDSVNVMYAGEIVESADTVPLFEDPKHPYTQGLLQSIPGNQEGDRLNAIGGTVPTPNEPASNCRFAPRCPKAFDECTRVHPEDVGPTTDDDERRVACLLYRQDESEEDAIERHLQIGGQLDGGEQP